MQVVVAVVGIVAPTAQQGDYQVLWLGSCQRPVGTSILSLHRYRTYIWQGATECLDYEIRYFVQVGVAVVLRVART